MLGGAGVLGYCLFAFVEGRTTGGRLYVVSDSVPQQLKPEFFRGNAGLKLRSTETRFVSGARAEARFCRWEGDR